MLDKCRNVTLAKKTDGRHSTLSLIDISSLRNPEKNSMLKLGSNKVAHSLRFEVMQ